MTDTAGQGRVRIDIGPPGAFVVIIAMLTTWLLRFVVTCALATIAVLLTTTDMVPQSLWSGHG